MSDLECSSVRGLRAFVEERLKRSSTPDLRCLHEGDIGDVDNSSGAVLTRLDQANTYEATLNAAGVAFLPLDVATIGTGSYAIWDPALGEDQVERLLLRGDLSGGPVRRHRLVILGWEAIDQFWPAGSAAIAASAGRARGFCAVTSVGSAPADQSPTWRTDAVPTRRVWPGALALDFQPLSPHDAGPSLGRALAIEWMSQGNWRQHLDPWRTVASAPGERWRWLDASPLRLRSTATGGWAITDTELRADVSVEEVLAYGCLEFSLWPVLEPRPDETRRYVAETLVSALGLAPDALEWALEQWSAVRATLETGKDEGSEWNLVRVAVQLETRSWLEGGGLSRGLGTRDLSRTAAQALIACRDEFESREQVLDRLEFERDQALLAAHHDRRTASEFFALAEQATAEAARLEQALKETPARVLELEEELASVRRSRSWRLTAPLRGLRVRDRLR